MTVEGEPTEPRPVDAIHYYAPHKRFVIEVAGGPVFTLTHSPDGVFYQLLDTASITDRSVEQLATELEDERATDEEQAGQRRAPTSVLSGRLQGRAKEGRADSRGRPTAWARFLAHIEGQDGATLLSTTFHGRTRDIAMGLPEDSSITAQGYLRLVASSDPENRRLSTFSVIHLLQFPGKPEKA